MSDLSYAGSRSSGAGGRGGRKGGRSLFRVFSVLFFIVAVCMFFGGLFFWLQKRQATQDSGDEKKIHVTPAALSGDLYVTLRDKVNYNFWPPHAVPVLEREDVVRKCLMTAQKYLTMTDLVQKSDLVWRSVDMIPLMVRHYAVAKPEIMRSVPTGPKGFAMLEVEGRPCIQLLIGFKTTPDMEFCFFKDEQEGAWKLDWPQFARYQPENWDRFVRGGGSEMGEFRVWITRDRMSEDKDRYAYKLVAPGMNGTDDRSIARPMVYVPKKSETGKRLFMLFKLNEEMANSPQRVLTANDDRDTLRVRIVLSRSKSPNSRGEYSFTLVKLLGEGWYGLPSDQSK